MLAPPHRAQVTIQSPNWIYSLRNPQQYNLTMPTFLRYVGVSLVLMHGAAFIQFASRKSRALAHRFQVLALSASRELRYQRMWSRVHDTLAGIAGVMRGPQFPRVEGLGLGRVFNTFQECSTMISPHDSHNDSPGHGTGTSSSTDTLLGHRNLQDRDRFFWGSQNNCSGPPDSLYLGSSLNLIHLSNKASRSIRCRLQLLSADLTRCTTAWVISQRHECCARN